MIPGPHRTKGGALVVGAEALGLPGPFGTWSDRDDQEEPAEPDWPTRVAPSSGADSPRRGVR